MRQPRIELGAQRWQRWILPLNHWRLRRTGTHSISGNVVSHYLFLALDLFSRSQDFVLSTESKQHQPHQLACAESSNDTRYTDRVFI